MRNLTYLACPYSHPNPQVRADRFRCACYAAAYLIRIGHLVYSPLSHTHPIAEFGGMQWDWATWEKLNRAYLENTKVLYVLNLEGWETSVGVKAEIEIAQSMGIPIEYLDPDEVP